MHLFDELIFTRNVFNMKTLSSFFRNCLFAQYSFRCGCGCVHATSKTDVRNGHIFADKFSNSGLIVGQFTMCLGCQYITHRIHKLRSSFLLCNSGCAATYQNKYSQKPLTHGSIPIAKNVLKPEFVPLAMVGA